MARRIKGNEGEVRKGRRQGVGHVSEHKQRLYQRIGEFLKRQRERAGTTQQQMSEVMGLTTAQYVSNIERGLSPPSIEYLQCMISTCGVNPNQLAFQLSSFHYDHLLSELEESVGEQSGG